MDRFVALPFLKHCFGMCQVLVAFIIQVHVYKCLFAFLIMCSGLISPIKDLLFSLQFLSASFCISITYIWSSQIMYNFSLIMSISRSCLIMIPFSFVAQCFSFYICAEIIVISYICTEVWHFLITFIVNTPYWKHC